MSGQPKKYQLYGRAGELPLGKPKIPHLADLCGSLLPTSLLKYYYMDEDKA